MLDIARERSYPTPLANSPLLPLMVLSLATQKNSPSNFKTPSTILKEYDYVIVGAGSAGSTIAGRLSQVPCMTILVLEAGKSPPVINDIPAFARNFWFTDMDWQYKTTRQNHTGRLLKNRQLIWPSGKGFGGSSLLNAMQYVRGNKKDYNDWAKQGADGWSYDDVLPYFKKMEDNRNIYDNYHGIGGPITVERPAYKSEIKDPIFKTAENMGYEVVDVNGERQTGFNDFQATIRSGQRCSTAKGYLVPAENRPNLHLLPNAFVKKILIKDKEANGVEFEVKGKSYKVNVRKEVIMSAGTTNTAQLLMLSGIGPKKELKKFKIPVVADLPVGENLQDHCSAVLVFELDKKKVAPVAKKLTNENNIVNYMTNRQGILASAEIVSALAFLNSKAVKPKKDDPNFQLHFIETAAEDAKTHFGMTDKAFNKVFGDYKNATLFGCVAQILHPRSRGFVRLHSADPHKPPFINPNYFADPKDLDDVVEGMKVCQKFGNSKALKKLGSKPLKNKLPGCEKFKKEEKYFKCQAEAVVITMSHQVGTASIGKVVDPELRVKGVKKLRVVDASIMPIIPSGNTNVPTIMVAEKAADIIKKGLTCRRKG